MYPIRPCRPDDFDQILSLLRQLWLTKPIDTPALHAAYDRALASPSQFYVCATDADKPIALASLSIKNSLWQEGHLGYVEELVVDANYRRRGIATQLFEHLTTLAHSHNCRRLELDSAFHRQDAHAFYKSQGFEPRAYLFSKPLSPNTP